MYKLKKYVRNLANRNKSMGHIYKTLNKIKVKALSFLNDDLFAKMKYKEDTGKSLNLKNPKTFNEKLWWLKSNYRTPLMTECSDKVNVKNYLSRLNLDHLLNPRYGVYNSFEEIPFNIMEGKFFIKCNHVSGINAFYDSENTSKFLHKELKTQFNKALTENYYYQSREWNYKNIKPQILVEYFLDEQDLLDYRFLCFNGVVKLIFVDRETASDDGSHNPHASRNVYDRDFNLCDFTVGREGFDPQLIDKPNNFTEMIAIAEKISQPFPFCRIDLYNLDGEIRFGEITFYPGGATQEFSSMDKDLEVASWINI